MLSNSFVAFDSSIPNNIMGVTNPPPLSRAAQEFLHEASNAVSINSHSDINEGYASPVVLPHPTAKHRQTHIPE